MRGGQALRGSSEFHAWGDSNLYLRRRGDDLTLSVEHRAAASIDSLSVRLDSKGDVVALTAWDPPSPPTSAAGPPSNDSAPKPRELRIAHHLAAADAPLTAAALRKLCRVRNSTLAAALAELVARGAVSKTPAGYVPAR